jgi:biotin transporter BioY
MVFGSILLFSIGVVWLHGVAGHTTWFESFDKGWFRFIPADLLKIGLTAALYTGCRSIGKS